MPPKIAYVQTDDEIDDKYSEYPEIIYNLLGEFYCDMTKGMFSLYMLLDKLSVHKVYCAKIGNFCNIIGGIYLFGSSVLFGIELINKQKSQPPLPLNVSPIIKPTQWADIVRKNKETSTNNKVINHTLYDKYDISNHHWLPDDIDIIIEIHNPFEQEKDYDANIMTIIYDMLLSFPEIKYHICQKSQIDYKGSFVVITITAVNGCVLTVPIQLVFIRLKQKFAKIDLDIHHLCISIKCSYTMSYNKKIYFDLIKPFWRFYNKTINTLLHKIQNKTAKAMIPIKQERYDKYTSRGYKIIGIPDNLVEITNGLIPYDVIGLIMEYFPFKTFRNKI